MSKTFSLAEGSLPLCTHCEDPVDAETQTHWFNIDGVTLGGYGHVNLCCDCMDLSCGMTLDRINEERSEKGKAPIKKPWKTT